MRLTGPLLTLLLMAAPIGARAQQSSVVVELFTSQGCSSCPPADALLTQLADDPGIIALALHVDYWDYLGWKDSFGSPAHTSRQRGYAKSSGARSIFTPQMVIQGQDIEFGHDAGAIASSIAARRENPSPVGLDIGKDGAGVIISVTPRHPPVGQSDVSVIRYIPSAPVDIGSGENGGKRIEYTNVVTDWTTIGRWDGESEETFEVEDIGEDPVAVIVQRSHYGPVVAAATYP